ncbi:ComEC/Rec2 family competence protein [Pseudoglutamicibacter cumminsii]|uniref:ComEC/Rec2 family competence protein n=1 Tax=Pseudoglutamicibacter cumminsii TaxID=156979 RepID=UPI0015E7F0B9|nr:ComEC/Rec2 family competence protein [Pseudoglutamicibacter cumminsii]
MSAGFSSCAIDAQDRLNAQAYVADTPLQARIEVTDAPRDIGQSMLTHVAVTPLAPPGQPASAQQEQTHTEPTFDAVIFTPSAQLPEDAVVGTQWTAWIRVSAARERASEPVSVAVLSQPVAESTAPTGFTSWVRGNLQDIGRKWGGDAGALIPGLIVGDRSSQSVELAASMVVSGLSHLTAVSGANVAAMVLVVSSLCRTLRIRGVMLYVVILTVIIVFTHIVGPDPSVLRACITGAVGAFAVTVGRPAASIALLALAATTLLLVDPWMLSAAAFQLSVLATFGILVGSRPIASLLQRIKFPRLFAEVTAVSAAATIACTPVLVVLDPEQSLWVIPINVLASPAAALVGLAAPIVMILGWIPWPWGWPLAASVGFPAQAITVLAQFSAENAPTHRWPDMPWGFVLAASLSWVLPATFLVLAQRMRPGQLRTFVTETRLRLEQRPKSRNHDRQTHRWQTPQQKIAVITISGLITVVLVLLALSFTRSPASTTAEVKPGDILFCDVGQGDALALIGEHNSALLIDVGAEPVLIDDCLTRAGVTKLCGVVITHLDLDHVGGIEGALSNRELDGEVIYGTSKRPPPVEGARRAEQGETMTCGAWDAEVIWAPHTAHTENGASVVTRARLWNGDAFDIELIDTGDLESEQAQLMLQTYELGESNRSVRVLKVAHHGSATGGTQLIEEWSPDIALIGVGADNDYGHPRQEILEALYRAKVSVHRTDLEGTLVVRPVNQSEGSAHGSAEGTNPGGGAEVLHERAPAGSILE